jgi:phytoene dehydrogenase-like protein
MRGSIWIRLVSREEKSMTYDVIIVGGGHNGLVCGTYLAKAGLSVLVLERRPIVGGAAVTEEFVSGFRTSIFSFIMSSLHPKVVADLDLARFGVEHLKVNDVVTPLPDGDHIVIGRDHARNREQIARFSKKDAAAYPEFMDYMASSVQVLRGLLLETPVDPSSGKWADLRETGSFLWRHRRIGDGFHRIYDALTMSAYDYVARWFESDVVRATFIYLSSIASNRGPRAPGTAFGIPYHLVGTQGPGFSRGGMGRISEALARAGESAGMRIRTQAAVAEILVRDGRATGVLLDDGEELRARAVVSNLAAPITFGRLVKAESLPSEFRRSIGTFRSSGTAFKLNIAVDRAPHYRYRGFDPQAQGGAYPSIVHIGPSPDYYERAWDEAKYGWYSSMPHLTPVVPSMLDDSLAPHGKHVVSIYGGHASYELAGTTWEAERDNFVKRVLDTMNMYVRDFSSTIVGMQVLLPGDIEAILGMPGGHESHGEVTIDQLFHMRPAPRYADYRSPIRGLYQCGASAHPAGGVSGVPGHNAAREFLKDWPKLKRDQRSAVA